MLWSQNGQAPRLESVGGAEVLYDAIEALSPKNEAQRALQSQALNLTLHIAKMRWLLFDQSGSSISTPFLIVLVFCLTIIFMSCGLFAPHNVTVSATLLVCALSVSGAMFLILELDQPFEGLIRISSAPVQTALAQLGK
jgi:hypothetical protein